ncbi:metallophosphoesterase [uncultured Alistipes sp.]|uniref:metallophosphoesterase family protein n=1 Tax=uncultured Alistipes sp. TaxID=538949 RepID=UPI00263163D3|nr:metallophosphoesterase [uncultured Alistipes sp.]
MIRSLLLLLLLAAPSAGAARPLRFAVLTDTHVGRRGAARELRAAVRSLARDTLLDFVLLAGDVAHDGRAAGHRRARRILRRLPQPLHITTGNHDAKEPARLASFRRWFGSGAFGFEAGGLRFEGISTGPDEPGRHATIDGGTAGRLAAACRAGRPVVVVAHHTPDLVARADEAFAGVDTTRIVLWIAGHIHRSGAAQTPRGTVLTCASTLDAGRYTLLTLDHGRLRVATVSPREDDRCETWYTTTLNL